MNMSLKPLVRKISLLFPIVLCALVPLSHAVSSDSLPCPAYEWPKAMKEVMSLGDHMRQKLLGEEMNEFSAKVGHCYDRDPVGLAEKTWCNSERDKKIEQIFKKNSLKNFCGAVQKKLIKEKLPNSKKDPSPYCQYANCGEGQFVGACLAYQYGYDPGQILICDSRKDHSWTLIPETGKADSYCLLDRWNSYRCGVKKKNGVSFMGDVIVPGKTKFTFTEAVCTPFAQQFSY
jgi:hypothetical protein